MKKILITGENSYIGTSFDTYMQKFTGDYSIDTLSTFNDEWEKVDFSGYDIVLHVAAIVHQKEKPDMKNLYFQVNRDLPIAIAKKAENEAVSQFILLSTMAVFGNDEHTITFDTVPNPQTFYGKSKLEADIAIQKLNSDTFNVVSIRPPMIYGKNSKGNYPRLAKLAKIMPIFPSYKNQRSMLYIDNLSECIRLIIDNQTSGYIYPQNKEYVCTADLVKTIRSIHGKKAYFISLFNFIIKPLSNRIGIFNKVFGDLVYDKEMSGFDENDYCVLCFEDSVKGSIC